MGCLRGSWVLGLTLLSLLTWQQAGAYINAPPRIKSGWMKRRVESLLYANLLECKDESCNFEEVVKQEGFVVVDFYANWCGPCKIAAKTFASIAEEFPDKSVKFVKVDTETHEDTVDEYGLKGLPVFGVFKNGKLLKKHEGNIGKDKLLDFINSGIQDS